MRILIGLLLFPLVAAAQTAMPTAFPDDSTPLTNEALRERVAGKVFRLTAHNGMTMRIDYKTNGFAFFDTSTGGRDSGPWRVEEGKLCADWRRATGGCSEVRALGDKLYIKRVSNGEVLAFTSE